MLAGDDGTFNSESVSRNPLPAFPASGSSTTFWGKYGLVDFEELRQIATSILVQLAVEKEN